MSFQTEYNDLLKLVVLLYIMIFLFLFYCLITPFHGHCKYSWVSSCISATSLAFCTFCGLESPCRAFACSCHTMQRFTCHFGLLVEPGISLLEIAIFFSFFLRNITVLQWSLASSQKLNSPARPKYRQNFLLHHTVFLHYNQYALCFAPRVSSK